MWTADFEDCVVESKKKRRKLDPKLIARGNPGQAQTDGPTSVNDLATHSRKIAEVKNWLECAVMSPEILLVTGPAGSAKTTTLKLCAQELGFQITEWINPVDKIEFETDDWQEVGFDASAYREPKQLEKFENFAFCGSRYQRLFTQSEKRLLLVEDFPNHFVWKPTTFFGFLSKYKNSAKCPVAFIVTDDEKLDLSRNLFPNHVKDTFKITHIKFNPMSNTGLMKVLAKQGNRIDKESLKRIAESANGDIRTALSNLKFSEVDTYRKSKNLAVDKDTSTEFFQILGRVLYPKRREKPTETGRVFLYDVFSLSSHFDSTFLSMLQENFINTFSSLEDVVTACQVLSECDLLQRYKDLKDYAALICVIGLMSANKLVKKGTFMAMNKSRWSGKRQTLIAEDVRAYPQLQITSRTLNLDVLPFLKHLPSHAAILKHKDSNRLQMPLINGSNTFKEPLPVTKAIQVEDEDETLIEEFDE